MSAVARLVMRAHPAADLFPMMSESALAVLSGDIQANGLQQPVVTFDLDGEIVILDGRNRYEACRRIGTTPAMTRWSGKDPIAFVWSANVNRRHLTESQCAMIGERFATLKHGSNRFQKVDAPAGASTSDSASQESAAQLVGVSRRLIQRARRVRTKGTPELIAAVESGIISVTAASEVAMRSEDDQRALVRQGPEALLEAVRTAKAPTGSETPVTMGFEREGHPVSEVRDGIVRTQRGDAEPAKMGRPLLRPEHHERVRLLTEQGCTVSDIVNQTGFDKAFVRYARSARPVSHSKKSVLAGAIEDAEVFAESWAGRASKFPVSWSAATKEEVEALIEALGACRAAATKVIQRLKKEAGSGEESK